MEPQIIPQQNISLSGVAGGGGIDIYQYFTASPYFAFDNYDAPERKTFLISFRGLSAPLREYIASDSTASAIYSTGQFYDLDDDQIYNLAKTVRNLLLGNIFIKDFPITVSSRLGIDDIKAGEIVNKIISESFAPIIEDLKRIQRSKFPDKISQMQKESRPAGFSQQQPVSEEIKKMPLSQSEAKPAQPSNTSPEVPPSSPNKFMGSQPQDMRPPLKPLPPRPTETPVTPQPTPNKQEFKVPNIDPLNSPRQDSNQTTSQTTQNKQPENKKAPIVITGEGGKSLEEELDKIANVIDLRAKPKE